VSAGGPLVLKTEKKKVIYAIGGNMTGNIKQRVSRSTWTS